MIFLLVSYYLCLDYCLRIIQESYVSVLAQFEIFICIKAINSFHHCIPPLFLIMMSINSWSNHLLSLHSW